MTSSDTVMPTLLADGFFLPEGPRWIDGRLWFSDMFGKQVVALDAAGGPQVIAEVEEWPSGIGVLPDGRVLVTSMLDRRLLVLDGGELVEIADLAGWTPGPCNDLVVDGAGRAYVGSYRVPPPGVVLEAEWEKGAPLILVDLSGSDPTIRVAAENLEIPNGCVITPDGSTMIVAETGACRLTAFSIDPDGGLSGRRTWAGLDGPPDGICLDAAGCVWVAFPTGPAGFQRVAEGGRVLARLGTHDVGGFACQLGGDDGHTLFLLEAVAPPSTTTRTGRVRTTRVPVGAAAAPAPHH